MLEMFILTVFEVALGVILAAIILTTIATNKRFMKWYLKKINKSTQLFIEDMDD